MDKLRRWLIDIENGKINGNDSGVWDYDKYGFDGRHVFELSVSEPTLPHYGKENLSIEEYIRVLRRKHFDSIKDVPAKVCMDYYNRCRDEFISGNLDVMPECLQQYKEDKRTAAFGFSMEYLRLQQRRIVRRMLECCCMNECHLKIADSVSTLEGYRMELGPDVSDVDDEMLKKYAFFRRFFSYNNWRYKLSDKEMVARHFYLNVSENDRDKIREWFAYYTLLGCIQMDMEDLSADEGYKMKQIESFDPYAVLELVDMIGDYAVDAARVRSMWIELMLRSEDIVRKLGHEKYKECFSATKKGDSFDRRFVLATIGLMRKRGWYTTTNVRLAEVLEDGERNVDTTVRYMKELYEDLKVIPYSSKVILSVIGVFKEN